MSDITALNEISKNEREITHPDFGTYVIKRPTHGIESKIEDVRTRQMNKDLQTLEIVEDPETGDRERVPAFLSRNNKSKMLSAHGTWTVEDDLKVLESEARYREVCLALDEAGFEGGEKLNTEVGELKARLIARLGSPGEGLKEQVEEILPSLEFVKEGDAFYFDEEIIMGRYAKARKEIHEFARSPIVDEILDETDKLHKRVMLYRKGVSANADLVTLRIREISLFADTLEARAENASRKAKVFYCTFNPTGERSWKSMADLEEEPTLKIRWLLEQIERFERLDFTTEAGRLNRFNFLQPLPAQSSSDASQEAEESSSAGESADNEPTSSSEPSA